MWPIGITTIAKKKQLPSWKRTQLAITLASLILFGFVVVLFLFINPLVAVVLSELGGLVGLALVYVALSRGPIPKDVERLRRDIERRVYTPAFCGGHGVLFFEDGGPTKPKPHEGDY